MKPDRSQIFISYSRKDGEWLKRLRVHLRPLENQYGIFAWSDTEIQPGSKWEEVTSNAINNARVAVLLISADFLGSEFISKYELPYLLEAANSRGLLILPIILSPSLFSETPGLRQYQSVNDPSSPLIELPTAAQEAIFVKTAQLVRQSLTDLPEPAPALVNAGVAKIAQNQQKRDQRPRYRRAVVIVALIAALIALTIAGNKFGQFFIVPGPSLETAELSGAVVDSNERPLQGARVTLDDFPEMSAVETSSHGVFNFKDIPRKYGGAVRVRVVMEGYEPNPYMRDVVIGNFPLRITLTRRQ